MARIPKVCKNCMAPNYARNMCKPCYMKSRRNHFQEVAKAPKNEFDYDAYWEWVKKELKIG